MHNLDEALRLYMDVFDVDLEMLADALDISPQHAGRLRSGATPLKPEQIQRIAGLSGTSAPTFLLAYLLLDGNQELEEEAPDIGALFLAWLRAQLAPFDRDTETHSSARTLFCNSNVFKIMRADLRHSRVETKGRASGGAGAAMQETQINQQGQ